MSTSESNTAKLLALRPVMEAFLKGETIECRRSGEQWTITDNPKWYPDYEYRMKKEPHVYYVQVATVYNKIHAPGTASIVSEQSYISQKARVGRRTDFPWEYIKVVEELQ